MWLLVLVTCDMQCATHDRVNEELKDLGHTLTYLSIINQLISHIFQNIESNLTHNCLKLGSSNFDRLFSHCSKKNLKLQEVPKYSRGT